MSASIGLKQDYKDDVLNTVENTRRKFRMISNPDGTFSFEDVTDYSQIGDTFGAADINAMTKLLNTVNDNCGKYKMYKFFVEVSQFSSKELLEQTFDFGSLYNGGFVITQLCRGGASDAVTKITVDPYVTNGKLKISVHSDGNFNSGDQVLVSGLLVL